MAIITVEQINLLECYRDKTYVSAVLCEKSSSYFNFYKNVFNIPLIISSSVMTILNSSDIHSDSLKIVNIIINGTTAITLAIVNNLKFAERGSLFKANHLKFTKLLHSIEDSLINDKNNISTEKIREYISVYDTLYENLDYSFPDSIKNSVRTLYKGKKVLPNILNCESTINSQVVFENPV